MKVTVAIPNYNHAPFLAERIESVLGQTRQDFEVLVLDDASTDRSVEVIRRYLGPRVRLETRARNSGTTFAQWARAFAQAAGEYVWIAESDDAAEPGFLERMVGVLEANPSAGYAYCQARLVEAGGSPFGWALAGENPDGTPTAYAADFVRPGVDELRICLRYQSSPVPNASSVLFRRSRVLEVGGPDPSYRLCGDLHLYARLLARGTVAYVAAPLNRYRHHGGTVRRRTETDGTGLVERYRFLAECHSLWDGWAGEAEAALDALADRWVKTTFRRGPRPTLGRQREIRRMARRVDPRILRRLAGALARHARDGWRRRWGR